MEEKETRAEVGIEVQKLNDEQILAKEIQLVGLLDNLEQLRLQRKQVNRRIEDKFFERQAEVLKNDTLNKISEEIERHEHNINALKIQIKTREVSI